MSRRIPEKEMKSLIALSGGVCAFQGCQKRLVEPGNTDDPAAFLGEIAHIVADSRQGPRGESPMSDLDRDKNTNLLLLCGDHHKIIDSQPCTYSVSVLRAIKFDHENRIRQATALHSPPRTIELKREIIQSSLLPLTSPPKVVFSAQCGFDDRQEGEVKKWIRYPSNPTVMVRFLIREGKIYTFNDLSDPNGPFADVIDHRSVERCNSNKFCRDAEGYRRFVTLLNKAMYKYTASLGISFDPKHRRFFFPAEEAGKKRSVRYRPLNNSHATRNVAWEPKRRSTGDGKGFWIHIAADLRFHRMSKDQWCLSIRPERHLTSDGLTSLPPEEVGRRVTSLKARMFNDKYLSEINLWRDYLAQSSARFLFDFGNQSALISAEFVKFDVNWPGIPGDNKPFKNQSYEDDLFTYSELDKVVRGEAPEGEDDEEYDRDDENAE